METKTNDTKIFDAHSHIRLQSRASINNFIKSHIGKEIFEGIVMIDPFIKQISCDSNKSHYACVKSELEDDSVYCTNCKRMVRSAKNIYREYNIKLLKTIDEINEKYDISYHPFVTVTVSERMLRDELNFYASNFSNTKFGIKIYTGLSFDYLDNIEFNSNTPLLIHTALKYDNQHPRNMINFLMRYDGPVLMAHFARLDEESIKILKKKENLFFDTSPASLMFDTFYKTNKNQRGILSPEDLYYKALDLIGSKKLVWGSDFPFGNIAKELELLNAIALSSQEREDILYNNSKSFFCNR